jgi:hypothetical protein
VSATTVATCDATFAMWEVGFESRLANEVDAIVRRNIRWRVVDDKLEPQRGVVRGRVTAGGRSVANALVTGRTPLWRQPFTTKTDGDGNYTLEDLPDGPLEVVAQRAVASSEPGVAMVTFGSAVVTNLELPAR